MVAEVDHISSDLEALEYSIGCLSVVCKEYLIVNRFEPLFRWGLAFVILGWAGAKIYLGAALLENSENATSTVFPAWFLPGVWAAALFYMGAAVSFLLKRHVAFIGFFLAALAVNSIQLMANSIQMFVLPASPPNYPSLYVLAIVGEEYFAWTAILLGAAAIWFLRQYRGAFAAQKM